MIAEDSVNPRLGGAGLTMKDMTTVICAWCRKTMRSGDVSARPSHGICMDCLPTNFSVPVETVESLTNEQLDELPRGLVRLAADGTIRRYNRGESEISGLNPSSVMGRNFFEVAPCTAVKEFRGEFEALVAEGSGERAFSWIFEFPAGRTFVTITMTKDPDDPCVSLFVSRAG